jgi:hypothetical protein
MSLTLFLQADSRSVFMSMGWDCLNCGHQRAYCSFPRCMSIESHGGMMLTGATRRTRRNTCPSATLSTPHGLNRAWTRTFAVRGRRLTAWAMVRPKLVCSILCEFLMIFQECLAISKLAPRWRSYAKICLRIVSLLNCCGRNTFFS